MDSEVATVEKQDNISLLRQEWSLLASIATTVLFLLFGATWLADLSNLVWFAFILVWLFAVILLSAFAIVHHAESLAIILGEPFGTLVLTLSVIGVEVLMISAVMLTGEGKPAIARDTMFSVVMILLGGMTGVSLLLGGLRHHEQTYNLQGANAFLGLIIPLAVLGLVLPNFTTTTAGPTLSPFQSVFTSLMSIASTAFFSPFKRNATATFLSRRNLTKPPKTTCIFMKNTKLNQPRITLYFSCCIFCRSSFLPNSLPSRSITELALFTRRRC